MPQDLQTHSTSCLSLLCNAGKQAEWAGCEKPAGQWASGIGLGAGAEAEAAGWSQGHVQFRNTHQAMTLQCTCLHFHLLEMIP